MHNERPAVDAGTALCLHFEAQWPGATEADISVMAQSTGRFLLCSLSAAFLALCCVQARLHSVATSP